MAEPTSHSSSIASRGVGRNQSGSKMVLKLSLIMSAITFILHPSGIGQVADRLLLVVEVKEILVLSKDPMKHPPPLGPEAKRDYSGFISITTTIEERKKKEAKASVKPTKKELKLPVKPVNKTYFGTKICGNECDQPAGYS